MLADHTENLMCIWGARFRHISEGSKSQKLSHEFIYCAVLSCRAESLHHINFALFMRRLHICVFLWCKMRTPTEAKFALKYLNSSRFWRSYSIQSISQLRFSLDRIHNKQFPPSSNSHGTDKKRDVDQPPSQGYLHPTLFNRYYTFFSAAPERNPRIATEIKLLI